MCSWTLSGRRNSETTEQQPVVSDIKLIFGGGISIGPKLSIAKMFVLMTLPGQRCKPRVILGMLQNCPSYLKWPILVASLKEEI